jgi:hypothetical protein
MMEDWPLTKAGMDEPTRSSWTGQHRDLNVEQVESVINALPDFFQLLETLSQLLTSSHGKSNTTGFGYAKLKASNTCTDGHFYGRKPIS